MMLRRLMITLVLLAALPALAGFKGCNEKEAKATLPEGKKGGDKAGAKAEDKTTAHASPAAEPAEALSSPQFTGTTEAHRTSKIPCQFGGLIKKVHVREGDYVKKDQPLVKMDTSDIALQKKQAQAAVAAAKAGYEVTRMERERMDALMQTGSISKSQFDMVDAQYKSAEAGVAQAKIALDMANKNIRSSVIRAPYSGLVVAKLVAEGERVTMMPPSVLLIIEEIDILDLRIQVPETEMQLFEEGQKITVHFRSIDRDVLATISKIVGSVNPMTRTLSVIAQIENSDHGLKPGMFAEIRLDEAAGEGKEREAGEEQE
ncbi:MAG: efflux RND transporter periplasmic adaptor subunit [Pseudomonadota bacterium]